MFFILLTTTILLLLSLIKFIQSVLLPMNSTIKANLKCFNKFASLNNKMNYIIPGFISFKIPLQLNRKNYWWVSTAFFWSYRLLLILSRHVFFSRSPTLLYSVSAAFLSKVDSPITKDTILVRIIMLFIILATIYFLLLCLIKLIQLMLPFIKTRLLRFLDLTFFEPEEEIDPNQIDEVFTGLRIIVKEEAYFLDINMGRYYSVSVLDERYRKTRNFFLIFTRLQFFYHHSSFTSGLLEPIRFEEDRTIKDHFDLKLVKSLLYEEWMRRRKFRYAVLELEEIESELALESTQAGFDMEPRCLFLSPHLEPRPTEEEQKKAFELIVIISYFLLFYVLPWFYLKGKRNRVSGIKLQRKALQFRQYRGDKWIDSLDYRDRFLMALLSGYFLGDAKLDLFEFMWKEVAKGAHLNWAGLRRKKALIEFRHYQSARMFERLVRSNAALYLEEAIRQSFYKPIYYSDPFKYQDKRVLRAHTNLFLKKRFFHEFQDMNFRPVLLAHSHRFMTALREHPTAIKAKRRVGSIRLEESFFLRKYRRRQLAERQILNTLAAQRRKERCYRLAQYRAQKKEAGFARLMRSPHVSFKNIELDFFLRFYPVTMPHRIYYHYIDKQIRQLVAEESDYVDFCLSRLNHPPESLTPLIVKHSIPPRFPLFVRTPQLFSLMHFIYHHNKVNRFAPLIDREKLDLYSDNNVLAPLTSFFQPLNPFLNFYKKFNMKDFRAFMTLTPLFTFRGSSKFVYGFQPWWDTHKLEFFDVYAPYTHYTHYDSPDFFTPRVGPLKFYSIFDDLFENMEAEDYDYDRSNDVLLYHGENRRLADVNPYYAFRGVDMDMESTIDNYSYLIYLENDLEPPFMDSNIDFFLGATKKAFRNLTTPLVRNSSNPNARVAKWYYRRYSPKFDELTLPEGVAPIFGFIYPNLGGTTAYFVGTNFPRSRHRISLKKMNFTESDRDTKVKIFSLLNSYWPLHYNNMYSNLQIPSVTVNGLPFFFLNFLNCDYQPFFNRQPFFKNSRGFSYAYGPLRSRDSHRLDNTPFAYKSSRIRLRKLYHELAEGLLPSGLTSAGRLNFYFLTHPVTAYELIDAQNIMQAVARVYQNIVFRPVYRGMRWKRRYSLRQWRLLKLTNKNFMDPFLLLKLASLYSQELDFSLFVNSLQRWGHRYGHFHFDYTGKFYEPDTNLLFLTRRLEPFIRNTTMAEMPGMYNLPDSYYVYPEDLKKHENFNLLFATRFSDFRPFWYRPIYSTAIFLHNPFYLVSGGANATMKSSSSTSGVFITPLHKRIIELLKYLNPFRRKVFLGFDNDPHENPQHFVFIASRRKPDPWYLPYLQTINAKASEDVYFDDKIFYKYLSKVRLHNFNVLPFPYLYINYPVYDAGVVNLFNPIFIVSKGLLAEEAGKHVLNRFLNDMDMLEQSFDRVNQHQVAAFLYCKNILLKQIIDHLLTSPRYWNCVGSPDGYRDLVRMKGEVTWQIEVNGENLHDHYFYLIDDWYAAVAHDIYKEFYFRLQNNPLTLGNPNDCVNRYRKVFEVYTEDIFSMICNADLNNTPFAGVPNLRFYPYLDPFIRTVSELFLPGYIRGLRYNVATYRDVRNSRVYYTQLNNPHNSSLIIDKSNYPDTLKDFVLRNSRLFAEANPSCFWSTASPLSPAVCYRIRSAERISKFFNKRHHPITKTLMRALVESHLNKVKQINSIPLNNYKDLGIVNNIYRPFKYPINEIEKSDNDLPQNFFVLYPLFLDKYIYAQEVPFEDLIRGFEYSYFSALSNLDKEKFYKNRLGPNSFLLKTHNNDALAAMIGWQDLLSYYDLPISRFNDTYAKGMFFVTDSFFLPHHLTEVKILPILPFNVRREQFDARLSLKRNLFYRDIWNESLDLFRLKKLNALAYLDYLADDGLYIDHHYDDLNIRPYYNVNFRFPLLTSVASITKSYAFPFFTDPHLLDNLFFYPHQRFHNYYLEHSKDYDTYDETEEDLDLTKYFPYDSFFFNTILKKKLPMHNSSLTARIRYLVKNEPEEITVEFEPSLQDWARSFPGYLTLELPPQIIDELTQKLMHFPRHTLVYRRPNVYNFFSGLYYPKHILSFPRLFDRFWRPYFQLVRTPLLNAINLNSSILDNDYDITRFFETSYDLSKNSFLSLSLFPDDLSQKLINFDVDIFEDRLNSISLFGKTPVLFFACLPDSTRIDDSSDMNYTATSDQLPAFSDIHRYLSSQLNEEIIHFLKINFDQAMARTKIKGEDNILVNIDDQHEVYEPLWDNNFYKLREFRPSDTRRFWPNDLATNRRILKRMARYYVYAPLDNCSYSQALSMETRYEQNKKLYLTLEKVFLLRDYHEFRRAFKAFILHNEKLSISTRLTLQRFFLRMTQETYYTGQRYGSVLLNKMKKLLFNDLVGQTKQGFKQDYYKSVIHNLLTTYSSTPKFSTVHPFSNLNLLHGDNRKIKTGCIPVQDLFLARRLAYRDAVHYLNSIIVFGTHYLGFTHSAIRGVSDYLNVFASTIAEHPAKLTFPSSPTDNLGLFLTKIFVFKFVEYYKKHYKKIQSTLLKLAYFESLNDSDEILPPLWLSDMYHKISYPYLINRVTLPGLLKKLRNHDNTYLNPYNFMRPFSEIFFDLTPNKNFSVLQHPDYAGRFKVLLQNYNDYAELTRKQIIHHFANDDPESAYTAYLNCYTPTLNYPINLSFTQFADDKLFQYFLTRQIIKQYYYNTINTQIDGKDMFMPNFVMFNYLKNFMSENSFMHLFNNTAQSFISQAPAINFFINLEDQHFLNQLHKISAQLSDTNHSFWSAYVLPARIRPRIINYQYAHKAIIDLFWELRHFTRYPYPHRYTPSVTNLENYRYFLTDPVLNRFLGGADILKFNNYLENVALPYNFVGDDLNFIKHKLKYFLESHMFRYTQLNPDKYIYEDLYLLMRFLQKKINFLINFHTHDLHGAVLDRLSTRKVSSLKNFIDAIIYSREYKLLHFLIPPHVHDDRSKIRRRNAYIAQAYDLYRNTSQFRSYPKILTGLDSFLFDQNLLINNENSSKLNNHMALITHLRRKAFSLLTVDEVLSYQLACQRLEALKYLIYLQSCSPQFKNNLINVDPSLNFLRYCFLLYKNNLEPQLNPSNPALNANLAPAVNGLNRQMINYKLLDKYMKNIYLNKPHRVPLRYTDTMSKRSAFFKNNWRPSNVRLRSLLNRRKKLFFKNKNGVSFRPYKWSWYDELRAMVGLTTPRRVHSSDFRTIRELTSYELEQLGLHYLMDYYPYLRMWYLSTHPTEYQNMMSYYTSDPLLRTIHQFDIPIQYYDFSELPILAHYYIFDREIFYANPFWASIFNPMSGLTEIMFAYFSLFSIICLLNYIIPKVLNICAGFVVKIIKKCRNYFN